MGLPVFCLKFGITPTVAETSQPKRARPGKESILNPGTGGSNEKAISRKRSAGRVGLRGAGIRCRKAGAGICTTAAAASGLHLDRLLYRWERGLGKRNEQPYHRWQFPPYQHPCRPPPDQ